MNQGIWTTFLRYCEARLPSNITLRAIDLPGYGQNSSTDIEGYTIDTIAQVISDQLRPNTILAGWSMGGLIAQQIANSADKNVLGHIQIASSPKFVQTDSWHGLKPEILSMFSKQLQTDHVALLKRFLGIQCLGLDKPKEQMKAMFDGICEYPLSSALNLSKSLSLLRDTDLRPTSSPQLSSRLSSELPCLRIYGGFDSLVSKRAIEDIQSLYPYANTFLIPKASHAPFLSHPKETFEAIDTFIRSISEQSRI
ncbi:MAG: pimeloyl-[acyl-carrier protein] methyl ester esterase [Alphaproteobacteria bacterium]|jgi:pimeloyl-[acyl-carrier protein] methyl ester esterase